MRNFKSFPFFRVPDQLWFTLERLNMFCFMLKIKLLPLNKFYSKMKLNHSISYSRALSIQIRLASSNFNSHMQFSIFNWKCQVIMPQISWFHYIGKTKANFIRQQSFWSTIPLTAAAGTIMLNIIHPIVKKSHSWKPLKKSLKLRGDLGRGIHNLLLISATIMFERDWYWLLREIPES